MFFSLVCTTFFSLPENKLLYNLADKQTEAIEFRHIKQRGSLHIKRFTASRSWCCCCVSPRVQTKTLVKVRFMLCLIMKIIFVFTEPESVRDEQLLMNYRWICRIVLSSLNTQNNCVDLGENSLVTQIPLLWCLLLLLQLLDIVSSL